MVQYNLLTPTYKILWSHSFLRQSLERNTTGYLVLGRLHDEFTVHVNDLARKNKLSIKYNATLPDCPQKVKSIHVPAGFNQLVTSSLEGRVHSTERISTLTRKRFWPHSSSFLTWSLSQFCSSSVPRSSRPSVCLLYVTMKPAIGAEASPTLYRVISFLISTPLHWKRSHRNLT